MIEEEKAGKGKRYREEKRGQLIKKKWENDCIVELSKSNEAGKRRCSATDRVHMHT